MVIEGQMMLRENLDKHTWSEGEIDKMMRNIMSHVGLPDAKRIVPEAYAVCYPEGPPKVTADYGVK